MAVVTSEILNNMLRSSLSDLKSFVEILNAELTEEGQGKGSSVAHKDEISRILHTFGKSEAYLKKSAKCLQEVEAKIVDHFDDEFREVFEEKALHDEIEEIIKIISGKTRPDHDDRLLLDFSVDENKISQQLENVKDILNEFHPLKFTEDAEDENAYDEEEEHLSRQLEVMQKKAMSRLEKRMGNVGAEDDDKYAVRLEEEEEAEELTVSSDDEEFDYINLERCENRPLGLNKEAKKTMDARLKAMWNDYKQQLDSVQLLNTKQLFTEALDNHPDVDLISLKHFSQFNNSILDLFSQGAIMMVDSSTSYVDPISKKEITQPVRNTICNHIYEKDTVYEILKKKKKMRCPLPGCSCRSFCIDNLVEDDAVAMKINKNFAMKREFIEQDTENMETEDEDDSNDSADIDTGNDDTQADVNIKNNDTRSQELF